MNTIFLIPTRSTSIPSKGPMIEPWARASAKPAGDRGAAPAELVLKHDEKGAQALEDREGHDREECGGDPDELPAIKNAAKSARGVLYRDSVEVGSPHLASLPDIRARLPI